MRIQVKTKQVSEGVMALVHGGGTHPQHYVIIEDETNGKKWAVTIYQGSLLVVEPAYAEDGIEQHTFQL